MSGLNKVMLIGRLGRDPETRWFEGGRAMSKLSLATSERYQDNEGSWHERTEWHAVVLWRELAEIADEHLRKGDRVFVEGRLKTRSWQDAEGIQHRTTEVVGERLDMLGTAEPTSEKATGDAVPPGPLPIDASKIPL